MDETSTNSTPASTSPVDDRITTIQKYVTTDGQELATEEEALLHQAVVDAQTKAANVVSYIKAQIPALEGDVLTQVETLFANETHLSAITGLLAELKPVIKL